MNAVSRSCWFEYKDSGTDKKRKSHQVVAFGHKYVASAFIRKLSPGSRMLDGIVL